MTIWPHTLAIGLDLVDLIGDRDGGILAGAQRRDAVLDAVLERLVPAETGIQAAGTAQAGAFGHEVVVALLLRQGSQSIVLIG